ncbi:MAG: NAD(P)-dependent oxidoreductase [Zavarzinia sp.]|nr:NAD(P)-dependent oxidoreductase [Zavarzinia sp.]
MEILICLLPLTAETRGILDRRTFSRMARGGFLVNVARGAHLVEEDLTAALDAGQLAGAAIDVFQTEPLPAAHPFWTDERIIVTPHVSALTNPLTAADVVAAAIRNDGSGTPVANLVDRARGY